MMKNLNLKISKHFVICASVLLLIFQSPLTNNLGGIVKTFVNSFDELFALMSIFLIICNKKINRKQAFVLLFLVIFLILGFIGTAIYNLQPKIAVIKDIINCSKFVLSFAGVMSLYQYDDGDKTINTLQKIFAVIVVVFFVLAIADQLITVPFLKHSARRFGRYALQLIYYHPAVLAQVLIAMLAILSFPSKSLKYSAIYKWMLIVMIMLTFRTKAMVFCFVYIIIWNYKFLMNLGRFRYLIYVLVLIACVFLAYDSIQTYYGSMEQTSRGKLTLGGIMMANRYSPFGAGFATYGTASAAEYYSPLYYDLGFFDIYGLGRVNTNYATDTFWPSIMAQFGYIGLFVFSIFVLYLVLIGIRMMKNRHRNTVLYLTLLAYLLICTTSGTGFFNPIAVLYGILMSICMNDYKEVYE